jgi:hypothetical protein
MHGLAVVLLIPGQIEVIPSGAFSRQMQTAARAATLRVVNVPAGIQESGVIIGPKRKLVCILTAHHLV